MSFLDNIEQVINVYPLVAFGAVFVAGVISSASPCVLATIPLVVGFVGGYADGDRKRAFLYSLAFIIGLAITFTACCHGAADARVVRDSPADQHQHPAEKTGNHRRIAAWPLFRHCLIAVRHACSRCHPDLRGKSAENHLRYGAPLYLRRRSLSANASGRDFHRLGRCLCQIEGCHQFFSVDQEGRRCNRIARWGVSSVAGFLIE
jgi:hypothetical protein